MSNLAILLLVVLAFVAGGALGWTSRGVHDGSTVTAASADTQAQDAVQAGASAAVGIDRAQRATETAVERVRIVTRDVPVAADCPPGAGPVSDALAAELRGAVR